ncbi:unnamed protein product [Ceratitis capitata]|uniref:(Mediterranean fruit fly) hypothetical protein n=1 Tax=Ceratitis capitata TaxID=7213 RepID=A0A811U6A6_CERCA|nr:unnamed protein product [Ceratitis capitata]
MMLVVILARLLVKPGSIAESSCELYSAVSDSLSQAIPMWSVIDSTRCTLCSSYKGEL